MREITLETLPDITKPQGHKYDHGHAVIVAGGPGKTGAARLAARAALRVGAGLVTIGCSHRALPEVAAQVTAIMVQSMDGPSGLDEMLEDDRMGALCLGPGLGLTQVTADLVKVALGTRRHCVLDADALTRFQRAPEALFGLLHEQVVITPHLGEFARLFPDIATDDPTRAAAEAAKRAGTVVLLKGEVTAIATPDGAVARHVADRARAVPWLATAGAGDVLAGLITGLMARGFSPQSAAETATWLHVEAARAFGPGLIAEDLTEMLPTVLAQLERDQAAIAV